MYYVVETQTGADGTGAAIVTTRADRNSAESDFHRVLSAAAVSSVYKHGAMLMSEDCVPVSYTVYKHEGGDGDGE